EIVFRLRLSGLILHGAVGWKKHADQNRNDGDDDQQLDEREGVRVTWIFLHREGSMPCWIDLHNDFVQLSRRLCQPRTKFHAGGMPATTDFIATWPSVPGTGIARSRNCPACKNLRKSGATLAGVRRFSKIACGANHGQRGASRRFPAGDSTDVPAAWCILAKRSS